MNATNQHDVMIVVSDKYILALFEYMKYEQKKNGGWNQKSENLYQ